jgi:outer membrane protein assembly factor BamE (lipoprotein component of BamABCDE complex)
MCFKKATAKMMLLNSLFLVTQFLFGCASTPQNQALRQVRVGMTKSDVLGLSGNPTRTDRKHGQDRWTYQIAGEESDSITYIFFSDGRVTYIGDAKAPEGPIGNSSAEAVPKTLTPAGGFRPLNDSAPETK